MSPVKGDAARWAINIEPFMAQTGVVVLDDVLPHNALEAARDRKTEAWAGDAHKVIEVLRWRRPDLVVLLVHTAPTGTAMIAGVDEGFPSPQGHFRRRREVPSAA